MTFRDAFTTCWREKYVTFSGRASRSEYWWFTLAFMLYSITASLVSYMLYGVSSEFSIDGFSIDADIGVLGFITLFAVAVGYGALLMPAIAVTVRRFHDKDLSGWWVLAGFVLGAVPAIGFLASIAMFVVTVLKGTAGDNRFGPDPLAGEIL